MEVSKNDAKQHGEKSGKISSYIVLCLFTAFNIGIFIPLDLYIANATEFLFPVKPLIRLLLLITAVLFAATFLVCVLTKGKANEICRAAIFGVSFALYIQSSYLSLNMELLTGDGYTPPVWKAILNTVIWLVLLAAPFFIRIKAPKAFEAVVSYIPAALIIIEIIALGSAAYMVIPKWDTLVVSYILHGDKQGYSTMKNYNTFGKEKNLIIILTDEYDSFYFDDTMKEHPETLSEFEGFTYYTNTVGKFGLTSPSVAYITSGSLFDELNGTYESTEFWQGVSDRFGSNIYADVGIPPESIFAQFADNYYMKTIGLSDAFSFSKLLYKTTFFRCMPEIIKPAFYTDGNESYDSEKVTEYVYDEYKEYSYYNLDFYRTIPTEVTLTDEDQFKFIYILGLHTPRHTTGDLQYSEELISPEETAIAVNKEVNAYMKMLKDNGVYDNSDILFMADHGLTGHYGKKYPLLMFKPAHQTETGIKISNAPISYDDMYPTLIKLSGGTPTERTIFDIAEDEQRTRYFDGVEEGITGNIKENPQ